MRALVLLAFLLASAWRPCSASSATAATPLPSEPATVRAPIAKVLRQYAVTSANDFPPRDPRDWRLLGSNDGGKTWSTLDIRRSELFLERHQRRVFTITNTTAFNLYRLQIECVRDPATADSVQLAEFEPLGQAEDDLDPAPLREDLIAAQGQNGPLETAAEAFDSQVETKWLDHAPANPDTRASWLQWQYTDHSSLVLTNVKRLLALGNRAERRYPVRIEAVAAGRLPGSNLLCCVDLTGHVDVPEVPGAPVPAVGQSVLLNGFSHWNKSSVGLEQLQLAPLESSVAKSLGRIALGAPLPGPGLYCIETEGEIRFSSQVHNHLVFELEDAAGSITVHILHPGPGGPQVPATRVGVRGLCRSVLNAKGEHIPGTLWCPGMDSIWPVVDTPASTNSIESAAAETPANRTPAPLVRVEQVRQLGQQELARGPRVRLRGVVTELFAGYLQDESAGVEIWLRGQAAQHPPSFGSAVELEGKADWAPGHGAFVRAERVVVLGEGKLPIPKRCSWSDLAAGRMDAQWIEVQAVVRSTDGSHLLLTCEGGQVMATIRSAPASLVNTLIDATLRVRGVTVAASDSRGQIQGIQVIVPSLQFVEVLQPSADPFSLPARQIGTLLQARGPNEFIHRVKVEGVLTCREDRKLWLQDPSGGTMAIAREDVILNSPASGSSWMFWQSPRTNTALAADTRLNVGDRIQVVGFPENRGYAPVLTEALVRKAGGTGTVAPVKTTANELAQGGLDATLVTLEAVLLRFERLGPRCILDLKDRDRVFQASLQPIPARLPALAPGSRLEITGVCQLEPLPFAELGKRLAAFKVLVGSVAGLNVLERPPWWTLKRALVTAGSLLVVLAMAAAWIGILRRQVEERTRELQCEIEEHEKTEARLATETRRVHAEIDERKRIEAEVERGHKQLLKASRLAGMAEVATSVLHNVGNILNSVNVLASSVVDQVQHSRISSVAKLGDLLREHQAELDRFMTEDSRGQLLPGYVQRLAHQLEQEQARLLGKVRSLTESIEHIKEIVATQQNYARVSGLLETLPLAEVVEDAIRIHSGALARHQVKVLREYGPAPAVTIDRHKLLQILFNLLENAKHACDQCPGPDKHVMVRIGMPAKDRLQLVVSDNGIGVSPENLPRVFDQDFSTRKGGHGFGLHSSILAAQDLGATLTARSDGTGHGATFILEFPISP